ncbi:MAG: 50S ribosomal protein L10 [Patescibacteria group bacterium]
MKSKEQKIKEIKAGEELFEKSQSFIFVDFSKVPNKNILALKKKLKEFGVQFKVLKKRLLKIIFKKNEIDFDPQSVFGGQMGAIFAPKDVYSIASPIYKFFEGIKILGAYDLKEKQFLEPNLFKKIALLPSREVLLAQLAGVLTAPIKMVLYILNEKSKRSGT